MSDPAKRSLVVFADVAVWVVAMVLALDIRLELGTFNSSMWHILAVGALAGGVQTLVGFLTGLYRGRYKFGAFHEIFGVTIAWAAATIVLVVVIFPQPVRPVPRSMVLAAAPLALLMMLGYRFLFRALQERRHVLDRDGVERVILYGAGEAGENLARALQADAKSLYVPVAFVDDDPAKQRLRLQRVPVRGTGDDLAAVARRYDADVVILSAAVASAAQMRTMVSKAQEAGLEVRVIPAAWDLASPNISAASVRPLDMTDLLGRRAIETDLAQVSELIHGTRVLITGAGGSIGSELAKQVHRLQPAELVLLDRDESALHALELALYGTGLLDSEQMVLADIRDRDRVFEVFAAHRPEIVFHAAALKHLPMLERQPMEAVKTNVWGTRNVIDAAVAFDVQVFVNISTDKAADPTSVLGTSKRITERLTAEANGRSDAVFTSVRFGNVLGSRGSVITAFTDQIDRGGPMVVTDPEVTRYFMTVGEAVQLVIQSAAISEGGEVLILDMGEPVSIVQVAQQMMSARGVQLEIVYSGLRPGEKLHEDLVGRGETDVRPHHSLISHTTVPPLDPDRVGDLALDAPAKEQVRDDLAAMATESQPEGVTHPTA